MKIVKNWIVTVERREVSRSVLVIPADNKQQAEKLALNQVEGIVDWDLIHSNIDVANIEKGLP